MRFRKVVSLTALLAFAVVILTSVVLYVVPQGRVAYWADWRLWGLSKTQWGEIHINTGILFLVALGVHTYLNWRFILNYLGNRSRKLRIFTPEFNTALGLMAVVVVGTYAQIPPFSTILTLNATIKDKAAQRYGEPPYGHAELSSLKTFAKKMALDVDASVASLKAAGYAVGSTDETLAEIAGRHGVAPQQIFNAMKKAGTAVASVSARPEPLPEAPPPGSGNLTLADLAGRYNLNLKALLRELAGKEIRAEAAMTLKQIAAAHNMAPADLYGRIKDAAASPAGAPTAAAADPGAESPEAGGMGWGRMTLAELCTSQSISLDAALQRLSAMGVRATPQDRVKTIAGDLKTTPFDLVAAIRQGG